MENEITIAGMNSRQRVFADIIWSCDEKDQVDNFINSLPLQTMRNEAKAVLNLIMLAVLEAEEDQESQQAAEDLLNKFKSPRG